MSRLQRLAALAGTLAITLAAPAGPALASSSWAGPDPSSNYAPGSMPSSCQVPTSAGCINAAVSYLNAARARLGQPAYALPSNFDALSAEQQLLVLSNLDRLQYGEIPVPGITAALSRDAAAAMRNDTDPRPSSGNFTQWTANWAGGTLNMPLAYGLWMYDDGLASDNLDCTASHPSGCWGHRHDVLWRFDSFGPLAMGAAAGNDNSGDSSFAALYFEGDQTYAPTYTYTWAQAVAAGANHGVLGSSSPASGGSGGSGKAVATTTRVKLRIAHLKVRGHRVTATVLAPSLKKLSCAVSRHRAHGWAADRFRACSAVSVFHVARGRYRLHVRQGSARVTRFFRVR
jgi:hypothetical protein